MDLWLTLLAGLAIRFRVAIRKRSWRSGQRPQQQRRTQQIQPGLFHRRNSFGAEWHVAYRNNVKEIPLIILNRLWIIRFPEFGNSGIYKGSSERAIEKVYSFESMEKPAPNQLMIRLRTFPGMNSNIVSEGKINTNPVQAGN